MRKEIKIIKKDKTGETYLGRIYEPFVNDFVIPSKGDLIGFDSFKIGEFEEIVTCKNWTVLQIKYQYHHKEATYNSVDICEVLIYVR